MGGGSTARSKLKRSGTSAPLSSVQLWSVDHRGLSHDLMTSGGSGSGGTGSGGCVTKIAMNGQGTTLVTGSTDGVVRMYNCETQQQVHAFDAHMEGGGVGSVMYKGRDENVLVTCKNKRVVITIHSTILEDLYPLLVTTDTLHFFFLFIGMKVYNCYARG